MAIIQSLARLSATLVGILHTRLELMSVEIEEELTRFSSYLLWSLLALFCAGVAVLLLILLLLAAFWDTHRFMVIWALLGVFFSAAVGLAWWLRYSMLNKPRLLADSLAELKKDACALRGENRADESD